MSNVIVAAVIALICASHSAGAADAVRKTTHIPAQNLRSALNVLAKERGLHVVYRAEVIGALNMHGAIGDLTTDEALGQLLADTGLTYRFLSEKTVTIVKVGEPLAGGGSVRAIRVAQEEGPDEPKNVGPSAGDLAPSSGLDGQSPRERTTSDSRKNGSLSSEEQVDCEFQEVIVTGIHIRGSQNVHSNILTMDREAIERTGYMRVQDVLATLLQNFSASIGESGTCDNGAANRNRGSAINLRGIGASATLVLVDGRRQASGGTEGSFVDISSIPFAAIQRIEVMTGGASAMNRHLSI